VTATATPGTRPSGALRILPAALLEARRPQRLIERSFIVYASAWWIFVSGFFEPMFYLLSMDVGLSSLVGEVEDGGQTYDYAEFVAPALMAVAAMNGAIFDSTVAIFFKLRNDVYDSILATPLSSSDIAVGEIGWAVLRGAFYSASFLVVMVVLGLAGSPWLVMAVPACALLGIAFSSVGMALTTYMRSWADFDYIMAITVPLMVFSATFYPVSSYGDWAWIVNLSPLYHGVALTRAANAGVWEWSLLVNIAVLVALGLVGLRLTSKRIAGLLLT
jgi:lipooligosaccharide transport system permease protein